MFDIAIIGAGPAGYNGAIKAAELGLSVALVERAQLGGTCLNRGCIPTKSLLKGAELIKELESAHLFGVNTTYSFSCQRIYERKDEVVEKLRKGIDFLMKKNKITVFCGDATLLDNHTISVQTTAEVIKVSAKNIILATGSSPSLINIEGIEHTLNSDSVLAAPIEEDNIAIIGGGVIGVEFASFFSMLGKKVTIIESEQRILPTWDRDVSVHLSLQLKKQGVQILTGAKVQKIVNEGKGIELEQKGTASVLNADKIILSIGRTPNIRNLGLDKVGIKYERRIIVDKNYQTNISNIYAVGDVSSPIQLAHLAEGEAIFAVTHIAGKESGICFSALPSCIYTLNEIACVGTTLQTEDIVVGKALLGANGKAIIEESGGFVKTFFDKTTKKLLGAVIMCSRATDMISELALALANDLTAYDISRTIHPHPTLSESVKASVDEAIKKLEENES